MKLEQAAKKAIEAIRNAAAEAGFSCAIVIVDDHGDIVAALRMDGCRPRWMRASIRKAYTAAVWDRDTTEFHKQMIERQFEVGDFPEPYTGLPGGITVAVDGETVAGIGVTGKGNDIAYARAGLAAFGA
ncbi:MAG TPA: heme-binding protein [Candidatus Acidoferrales bacterium]|nr:heme-binding protein [Candidatus Acidoferrales bacterium]